MALSVYAKNVLHETQSNDGWTKLYNLVPEGATILDLGCSTGNFGAELMKNKKCTVVGVDINEDDLKVASKHLKATYKRNIERDEISDLGMFDAVVMADVIEHLIDPVSALKKIKKQLKPGGLLIFSVPNMANFATRLELLAGRFTYTEYGLLDETHLHYYDRVELEKVFARAGLQVTKYNNSIRDVPPKAAKDLLKSVGLTPNDAFWKLAGNIDSITFQFIGTAKVGTAKHVDVSTKTPHDFISDMIDGINQQGRDREAAIREDFQARLKELERSKREIQERLHLIENSKGWRAVSKLYKAKQKLKRS
jgi:2-polyprenyl-3-methyl-5-hydroxy-6-metoxy-1,4-benzoquinol methylase